MSNLLVLILNGALRCPGCFWLAGSRVDIVATIATIMIISMVNLIRGPPRGCPTAFAGPLWDGLGVALNKVRQQAEVSGLSVCLLVVVRWDRKNIDLRRELQQSALMCKLIGHFSTETLAAALTHNELADSSLASRWKPLRRRQLRQQQCSQSHCVLCVTRRSGWSRSGFGRARCGNRAQCMHAGERAIGVYFIFST